MYIHRCIPCLLVHVHVHQYYYKDMYSDFFNAYITLLYS